MEAVASLAFLVFGLGFFIYVMRIIEHDYREQYERKLMEAREFGFGGKNQHTTETLNEKK